MAISLREALIEKYLDCSTGHITWEDSMLLPRDFSPLTSYSYNFGMFVFTKEVPRKDALKFGFSETLLDILEAGALQDCVFIRFDGDGMEYDELPTFEWPGNKTQAIQAIMTERLDIPMIMSRLNDPVAISIIERRLKGEEEQAWETMRRYKHEVLRHG